TGRFWVRHARMTANSAAVGRSSKAPGRSNFLRRCRGPGRGACCDLPLREVVCCRPHLTRLRGKSLLWRTSRSRVRLARVREARPCRPARAAPGAPGVAWGRAGWPMLAVLAGEERAQVDDLRQTVDRVARPSAGAEKVASPDSSAPT